MKIDWDAVSSQEKARYVTAYGSHGKRFSYWALRLVGLPYGWGKENLFATDCSGSVCFPLLMMGYNIRTTASALRRSVFVLPGTDYHPDEITAAFYWDSTGAIVHVTPFVGLGVVLHASSPKNVVELRKYSEILGAFDGRGEIRVAEEGLLASLSKSGSEAWGLDPETLELIGGVVG